MALRENTLKEYAPSLAAIRQATWELVTLLIEQADFGTDSSAVGRAHVTPAQLQLTSMAANYELLRYAGWGAVGFIIDIDAKYSDKGGTVPFFSRVSYQGPEQGVFATFNNLVYEELGQLQRGIRVLRQQNALTLTNLVSLMKGYTPHITFGMVVKRVPVPPVTMLVDKLSE
jgi:hypothetical protein